MQAQAIPIAGNYTQLLAAVRQLPVAEQDKLVQALRHEREDQVDADARRVARRVRQAGVRISQVDIDQEVEAVRSRRYAAGHHR